MTRETDTFVEFILTRAVRAIVVGGVFAGMPVMAVAAANASAAGRPNVVLFLVDDLGYGDLACHGNPHVRTPHIDAFGREAVEFTRFHVSPVCSPTRASLMTGRYNFRTGVADVFGAATQMDGGEVTLAERLRAAGYATGLFGKWHLGDEGGHTPNAHGFPASAAHPRPLCGTVPAAGAGRTQHRGAAAP